MFNNVRELLFEIENCLDDFFDSELNVISKDLKNIDWDATAAEKNGFEDYNNQWNEGFNFFPFGSGDWGF